MTWGVPQGSVLRLLLPVAYANDIDDVIHYATLLRYADDMKLHIELERLDRPTLQQHSLAYFKMTFIPYSRGH